MSESTKSTPDVTTKPVVAPPVTKQDPPKVTKAVVTEPVVTTAPAVKDDAFVTEPTDLKDMVVPVKQPEPVIVAPVPEVVVAPVVNVAANRNLAVVTELLDTYKSLLTKPVISTAGFAAAAQHLTSVMDRVLNDPNPQVVDVVLAFFKENKNSFLNETVALSGMASVAADRRGRAELAYMVFRKAAANIDIANPLNVNQTTLQKSLRCPKLVSYLSNKAKSLK